jgi:hypothetical protein
LHSIAAERSNKLNFSRPPDTCSVEPKTKYEDKANRGRGSINWMANVKSVCPNFLGEDGQLIDTQKLIEYLEYRPRGIVQGF